MVRHQNTDTLFHNMEFLNAPFELEKRPPSRVCLKNGFWPKNLLANIETLPIDIEKPFLDRGPKPPSIANSFQSSMINLYCLMFAGPVFGQTSIWKTICEIGLFR